MYHLLEKLVRCMVCSRSCAVIAGAAIVISLRTSAVEVSAADQFESAVKVDGEVVLQADISLDRPVFIEGQAVTIDLNGHTLAGTAGAYLVASNEVAFVDGSAVSRAAGFNGKLVNLDLYLEGGAASYCKVACNDSMVIMNEGGQERKATLIVENCDFASSVKPSCFEAYGNTETFIDNEKTGEANACVLKSEKDSCYYAQGDNNMVTNWNGELSAPAIFMVEGQPKESVVVIKSGSFVATPDGAFGPYALIDADPAVKVVAYGGTYSELLKNPDWLVDSYLVRDASGKYIVRANGILLNTYTSAARFVDKTPEEVQDSLAGGKSSKYTGFAYDTDVVNGVEVHRVEGTVDIVASAPKKGKAKTTVNVKIGKKKVSLKLTELGAVNEMGEYELSGVDKKGNKIGLKCVDGRYTGTLTVAPGVLAKDQLAELSYQIDAVRLMDKKADATKQLDGSYVSFVPSKEMNGYCVLAIKVSGGKAKISAVSPTGSKLTGTSSLYDVGTNGWVAIPIYAYKKTDSVVSGVAWLDPSGKLYNETAAGWPMVFTCTEAPHNVVSASGIFGGLIQAVPDGNYFFETEASHPAYVDKRGTGTIVTNALPTGLELSQKFISEEVGSGYKIVKLFQMKDKGTKPKKVDGQLVFNGPTDSKLTIKNNPKTGVLTGSYLAWYESEDRSFSKSDKVKLCGLMVSAESYNSYLESLGIEEGFVDCPMGVINGVAKDLGKGKKAVKPVPAQIVKSNE